MTQKVKTKVIIFLLVIVLLGVRLFMVYRPKEVIVSVVAPVAETLCFGRIQEATPTAPYHVEEHILLMIDGTSVTGTKRGTQAGPDMTNGFEGTLSGSKLDTALELVYSYTIEGSTGKELELYTLGANELVKKRWALEEELHDGSHILVPDHIGAPTLITYTKEVCPQ
jgi:hypothetical protein